MHVYLPHISYVRTNLSEEAYENNDEKKEKKKKQMNNRTNNQLIKVTFPHYFT